MWLEFGGSVTNLSGALIQVDKLGVLEHGFFRLTRRALAMASGRLA